MKDDDGVFAVLKNRQFVWLFISNVAFFFAMQAQIVFRSWLAFKLTDSEFDLGLVAFCVAVPMFILSPFGGMMADRMDRKKLIIAGQFVAFITDLIILLLLQTGLIAFWHLLASAAVNGSVFPFIMPSRSALVVNVVGKNRLEKAMALNMGGMNTARVLGPAVAGFMIDLIGVANAYVIGVTLFGLGVLLMFKVDNYKPDADSNRLSPLRSIAEGASYIIQHRLLLILILFGLIPMFLAMPFQNLLVVFAEKVWNVGPQGFGLLSAAIGVGGILGSVWVALIRNTYRRLFRIMVSMLAFAVLLFFFSISPWFWAGLILVFLANVFVSRFQTLNNTSIHLLIPDTVRGRISSFLMMSFSLPLLGTLPVSAIAEEYGAPFAVALSSVLAVIIALMFLTFSTNLRQMDIRVLEASKS